MTVEHDGITPVTTKYTTSLEKWRGIREFAVANGFDGIDEIDAMIKKIEDVGDVVLQCVYTLDFLMVEDYLDYMFNEDYTPCPHCLTYVECNKCPLFDKSGVGCCNEWNNARKVALETMRKLNKL